jgi:transposase
MEHQYIGVDLHKASFQACALSPAGTRLWEGRFDRTAAGIAAFVARGVTTAHVAVEATGPTWCFVDAIQAQVARICVVDTRKTKLKAGFAAKTDRLDARRLADALRRESVVSIYIPPSAVRELREICRGRHHLVRVRTKLMQAIRALLLRHDAGDPPGTRLLSPRARVWLQRVELAGETQTVLRRLMHALEAIDAEATAADAVVRTRAAADPIAHALQTLDGVGPVIALTLRAEIGAIERFPDGPRLACYAGLVPRVERSAGHGWSGPITRDGSPWLRWVLVEAAVHAIKRTDRTGKWARRLALRKGVRKARVALARQLCRDIVRVWPKAS